MKHLRSDYDAIQPWPTKRPHIAKDDRGKTFTMTDALRAAVGDGHPIIPDDEPVFLIRAQDAVGPAVVELWAHNARAAGADPELCNRVLDWANAMRVYAQEHGSKVPDVPDGALR